MSTLDLGHCTVDLLHQRVSREGEVASLTTKEGQLLAYLVERPAQTVAREELQREVWQMADHVLSRAVDHAVRRLRVKIEADPQNPTLLTTVYGEGYLWTGPAPGAASPAPTTSAATSQHLLGRKEELDSLEALAPGSWIEINGPPGVGKTALARAAFEQRSHAWCTLEDVDDPEPARERIAQALGVDGTSLTDALALSALECLVLDGADGVAEHLAGWHEELQGTMVSTTRRRAPAPRSLMLSPLDQQAATALLDAQLQADGVVWRAAQCEVVLRFCEGIPAALTAAAAQLALDEPDAVVRRLRETDVLGDVFGAALDALAPETWRALATVVALEGARPEDLALVGLQRRHLSELVDRRLVRQTEGDGRLMAWRGIAALVRADRRFAEVDADVRRGLLDEAARQQARTRTKDDVVAWAWGERHRRALLRAGQSGTNDQAADALLAITHLDGGTRNPRGLEALLDRIDLEALDPDRRVLVTLCHAVKAMQSGDIEGTLARIETARAEPDAAPEVLVQAQLEQIGLLEHLGAFDRALALAEDALAHSDAHGLRWWGAWARLRRGRNLARLGRFDEAHDCVDEAIASFEEHGARQALSEAWMTHGYVSTEEEDAPEALRGFRRALDHAPVASRVHFRVRLSLGDSALDLGRHEEAHHALVGAAELAREAGQLSLEVGARVLVARVALDRGDHDAAAEALEGTEPLIAWASPVTRALHAQHRAWLLHSTGQLRQAQAAYRTTLRIDALGPYRHALLAVAAGACQMAAGRTDDGLQRIQQQLGALTTEMRSAVEATLEGRRGSVQRRTTFDERITLRLLQATPLAPTP